MKFERLLDIAITVMLAALVVAAMVVGCRAMRHNPELWLFAAVAVQSPRGAETFGSMGGMASVRLAWDAAKSGADGYRVYYRKSGEPSYTRSQDAGPNLTLRVIGLERKTTYRFIARAYWDDGTESGPSNEVSYRTASSPSWK